ncbi:hypothetical protein ES703_124489 [subsurface metagenome]
MTNPREFECIDVFGVKVSCSKKRWGHIIKHAEMANLQNLVKSIIIKPDFVNRSRLYANAFTFYRKCLLTQLGRDERYIRVALQYNVDEEQKFCGGVMSAMACDGSQLGEVLIWKGRAI